MTRPINAIERATQAAKRYMVSHGYSDWQVAHEPAIEQEVSAVYNEAYRENIAIEKRQRVERMIVRRVVKDALAAGYALSVDDGGEELILVATLKEAMDALMNTDDDILNLSRAATGDQPSSLGWVRFVYGNDGWDVVNDYSTGLDALMEPIEETLIAKLEARA